ncbi:hypothetical protein E3N88_12906 [Mikania micrantha]|uniref:Reverse transcriptase zinc-binding domain-containing protein n=1 Tax=Mikania micrantha TaxID=192012 RepID=A0A5N6P9C4_9ASTR|nr:hypothetical protein E3N88_12906 [Mikania micrantha]
MKGTWSNINKLGREWKGEGKNIEVLLRKQVGDGNNTMFWKHAWFGFLPFKILFPNLFALESIRNCKVAQRIHKSLDGSITFTWDWKRSINDVDCLHDLDDLESMVQEYNFKEGVDKWIWHGSNSEIFSTKSCRLWIDKQEDPPHRLITWLNWTPPKVLCFVWRLAQNRVPTAANLVIRRIQLRSIYCSLCRLEEETVEHLFYKCPVAQETWRRI